jgi:hypothetical protein
MKGKASRKIDLSMMVVAAMEQGSGITDLTPYVEINSYAPDRVSPAYPAARGVSVYDNEPEGSAIDEIFGVGMPISSGRRNIPDW